MKLNVDVTTLGSRLWSFGSVIRDEAGGVWATPCWPAAIVEDPSLAEAVAVSRGMHFSFECCFR